MSLPQTTVGGLGKQWTQQSGYLHDLGPYLSNKTVHRARPKLKIEFLQPLLAGLPHRGCTKQTDLWLLLLGAKLHHAQQGPGWDPE